MEHEPTRQRLIGETMKDSILRIAALSATALVLSAPVNSGVLDEASMNVFEPNTPALADEVNANFEAIRDAVNRLDEQTQDTSVISFPANALSFDPNSDAIEHHQLGLHWEEADDALGFALQRPKDYAGGDMTLTIYFRTGLQPPEGDVIEFGVRPDSADPPQTRGLTLAGDPIRDEGVAIPSMSQFSHFRGIQELTIPELNRDHSWWIFSVERLTDQANPYEGSLYIHAVSLEYSVVTEE